MQFFPVELISVTPTNNSIWIYQKSLGQKQNKKNLNLKNILKSNTFLGYSKIVGQLVTDSSVVPSKDWL